MFSTVAGMYMAAKVHFAQTKANLTKRQDKQVSEMLYRNNVNIKCFFRCKCKII